MDKYLVIGDPVDHSISPFIHTRFAKDTGQELEYSRQRVKVENFAQEMARLIGSGIKGMNITLPLKEHAFKFADSLSPQAKLAGAVNTFKIKNSKILADNTDGIGLVRDISYNLKFKIKDKNVLLLGAGGAAKGILKPLLNAQPRLLVIANRTITKAVELKDKFKAYGVIKATGFSGINREFDLIINATSASVDGKMLPVSSGVIGKYTVCYDLMYSKEPTVFLKFAHEHNAAKAIDGLGMLVEQAAEAFYIWRGVRPETEDLLAELRS